MTSKNIKQLIKQIKNNNPGLFPFSYVIINIEPIYYEDGINTVWKVDYLNKKTIKTKFLQGEYSQVINYFDYIL